MTIKIIYKDSRPDVIIENVIYIYQEGTTLYIDEIDGLDYQYRMKEIHSFTVNEGVKK